MVVGIDGVTLYFCTASAARSLRPEVADTEALARILGCPYVWGERESIFSCMYKLMGGGISSELGTARALQQVLAPGVFRVKPAPSGVLLRDVLLGRVLPASAK